MTIRILLLLLAVPAMANAGGDFVLREIDAGILFETACGSHEHKIHIVEQLCGGGAVFDYDFDGDLDLYFTNGTNLRRPGFEDAPAANALYRNEGDFRFVEVTAQAGVGDTTWGIGAMTGDVDGDGDTDLFVTNYGKNVLLENLGDGSFRDISGSSGLADPGMAIAAAFGDLDGDDDYDLYVTNYVNLDLADPPLLCDHDGFESACGPLSYKLQKDLFYRNEGRDPKGRIRFSDMSKSSGIHEPEARYGLGVVMGHVDSDDRLDILVANDSGPNFFFQNMGQGRFEESAWLAGVATQAEGRFQAGMGIDLIDVDRNGLPDIFVTNFSNDHNTLYMNHGDGLFLDASSSSGLGQASRVEMGWGVGFADYDQDGDLDLYLANGHIYPQIDTTGRNTFHQADQFFLNDGRGRFTEAPEIIQRERDAEVSRGVASGDLDLDGDLDLVVLGLNTRPVLYRNDYHGGGHGFGADLRAANGATAAPGTRAGITTGPVTQVAEVTTSGSYAIAKDPRLHWGLGDAKSVDRLDIIWASGKRQLFLNLPASRTYVLTESPQ